MKHETALPHDDEGRGEAVVFLHAFPLDARMWHPQRSAFASSHRVITPDLRGFGRAAHLDPPTSVDEHADDVLALLDRLGLSAVNLVGLSMGGYVALALARKQPQRIVRLALADTRATADTDAGRKGRADAIHQVETKGPAALAEQMVPQLLGPNAPESLRAFVRDIGQSQSRACLTAALGALRDRPDRTALLPTLAMPIACLVGERDTITPPTETDAMAHACVTATVHRIPGAGHLSNLESPGAFDEALRDLLGSPADPMLALTERALDSKDPKELVALVRAWNAMRRDSGALGQRTADVDALASRIVAHRDRLFDASARAQAQSSNDDDPAMVRQIDANDDAIKLCTTLINEMNQALGRTSLPS